MTPQYAWEVRKVLRYGSKHIALAPDKETALQIVKQRNGRVTCTTDSVVYFDKYEEDC